MNKLASWAVLGLLLSMSMCGVFVGQGAKNSLDQMSTNRASWNSQRRQQDNEMWAIKIAERRKISPKIVEAWTNIVIVSGWIGVFIVVMIGGSFGISASRFIWLISGAAITWAELRALTLRRDKYTATLPVVYKRSGGMIIETGKYEIEDKEAIENESLFLKEIN